MKDRNELASFLYHRSVVNPHVGYDGLSDRLKQGWIAYADEIMGFLDPAPPTLAWHEQAAQWIEHKADVSTNSLHCGDNSMTISLTHKYARTLRALAKEIRDEAPPVHSAACTDTPVAWIAFAGNGNIRFWTADADRAGREKTGGMDLRAFTLAELVSLAAKRAADDDFLRNIVDWTHIYAFSGDSWISHKTADILIACARQKKATQEDADALKSCPTIRSHAEAIGLDLIAIARNDRGSEAQ